MNHIILYSALVLFCQSVSALSNDVPDKVSLSQTSKAFASVAKSISPSVVFIKVENTIEQNTYPPRSPFSDPWPFSDEFFERFFGPRFPQTPTPGIPKSRPRQYSQGSGFVFAVKSRLLSDKTYILTNHHVISNAKKILVTFEDRREMEAEVVGTDPHSDIALLAVDSDNYKAVKIGDSDALEVGEWVVAMGSPFGLNHSLTVGVVSAKGRSSIGISDYENFIQTDAAINPGNSGGPLVNLQSEVVGMNTAIFSKSGGYMGIGFAIPINLVKNIANQLLNSGEVSRGFLGVIIQNINSDLANLFDLDTVQGVLVSQVVEDSPASIAGLMEGDVIIKLDGLVVNTSAQLRNLIALSEPGMDRKLELIRNGKKKTVSVKISKLANSNASQKNNEKAHHILGLTVQTITQLLSKQYGIDAGVGVLVTEVKEGSIAQQAGILKHAIILEVARTQIKSANQFYQLVMKHSEGNKLLLLLKQNGQQQFVVLSWD